MSSSEGEELAELYSILYTINTIEKVFIKSMFKSEAEKKEYSTLVDEMLTQWKSLSDSLGPSVSKEGPGEGEHEKGDLQLFSKLQSCFGWCPRSELESLRLGIRRISTGVNGFEEIEIRKKENDTGSEAGPDQQETVRPDANTPPNLIPTRTGDEVSPTDPPRNATGQDKKAIAEATSAFITLLDAIKLNYDTKDTLHPLFSDVLVKASKISADFEGRNILVTWLIKLNKLDIVDIIPENELKQMLWDVDTAYNGFFNQLWPLNIQMMPSMANCWTN